MSTIDRRGFIVAGAAAVGVGGAAGAGLAGGGLAPGRQARAPGDDHRGPASIASGNGIRAVEAAYEMIMNGRDPADAVVRGVGIVEADPEDMSVGYGGLPNEEGVVSLDASVMHGPSHRGGSVGAIEDIMHPAQVALDVLRKTDHCMLVGEGAKRFALAMGHKEQNLLTERARQAWLRWKMNLNPDDDWLDRDQQLLPTDADQHGRGDEHPDGSTPFTYGTIHCAGVTPAGDVAAVTTTSGLSWKIPGRIGDSPIIGAGMYVDNAVGAAGATGRGEAVIQSCGAFLAVRKMEDGLSPTEACLAVLRHIADRTKLKRLRNDRGEPNFNVTMYAMRKDGAYGSACMHPGGSFAVATAGGAERVQSVPLFER